MQIALEELQQAFNKWDGIAVDKASKTTRFSFFTALLGPVAVLLLTVQILAFPHTSAIAITLIGLELAALLFALIVGFAHFGPSPDAWIRDRLRAEVLRRERHLISARVGPYLTTPDPTGVIRQRLQALDNDITEPLDLIPLQDPHGRPCAMRVETPDPMRRRHPIRTACRISTICGSLTKRSGSRQEASSTPIGTSVSRTLQGLHWCWRWSSRPCTSSCS